MTLVEFLRARLGERRERATALMRRAQENELAVKEPRLLGRHIPGWYEWPAVEQLARDTLADVEATLRILDEFERWQDELHSSLEKAGLVVMDPPEEWLAMERMVCLFAVPHADHPDYDPAWTPS